MARKKKKRIRTNYVRGREVEYKAKAFLIKEGYLVTRASSSKGAFDIIAYGARGIRFIQLKREKTKQGSYPSEREVLRQIEICQTIDGVFNGIQVSIPSYSTKELWIWTDGLGWSQWIIQQDGNDEHRDLRRGASKANKRRGNKASTRGEEKPRREVTTFRCV